MPQTLLAVLALILASLVSYNQQRNSAANYETMLQNEIEMAASGTLMHVIELVASRSFDERSTPEMINERNYLPYYDNDFISSGMFGDRDRGTEGCDLLQPFQTPDCDDVDDVDGLQGERVAAMLSNGRELPFTMDIDVRYVVDREASQTTNSPTRHKLVTVTAHSNYLPNGSITVERVVSYDPIKAEMEYEAIYGALEGSGLPWGYDEGGEGGGCQTGQIC